MKLRNILYAALGLAMTGAVSSCLEDEGNYDYKELAAFYVDSANIQKSLLVTQFNTLQVQSALVFEGDKSDLTYAWSIYQTTGQMYSTDNKADTISTEPNLSTTITVKPGSYYLEYCATQKSTGYRAFYRYNLTVESAVGTGLMVLYGRDGKADIDMVKTPLFMGGVKETSYSRATYSRANPDKALNGTPVGCWPINDYINIFTDQDGVRVSADDMSEKLGFNKLFWKAPSVCKPQAYTKGNDDLLINDGKAYATILAWGDPYFGAAKLLPDDDYEAAPCALNCYGAGVFVYDESKGRFLQGGEWSSELSVVPAADLHDLNLNCLFMDQAYQGSASSKQVYAFMQEKSNPAQRYIYSITQGYSASNFKLNKKYDISACPRIADALYFSVSNLSPICFYATKDALYRISFDESTGKATAEASAWSCPADEDISFMRFFSDSGLDMTESPAFKYLMVATHKGSEGKVYVLSLDPVSGVVKSKPAAVFEGFGVVKDIKFKTK